MSADQDNYESITDVIDRISSRFEHAWRAGEQPRIEGFVREATEEQRPPLLRELLATELELRREYGESPTAEEYIARFPTHGAVIAEVFNEGGKEGVHQDAVDSITLDETVDSHQPARDVAATPQAGTSDFGDYELLDEIARGGMGVVYKARQKRLNRTVALKMILAGTLADGEQVKRFQAEAEAAARLDHSGIVPVFEVGQLGGQHFFSMGFVDGPSLADVIGTAPLKPKAAARLLASVTDAVAHAHSQGIIHRDLKPQNILLAPCSPDRSQAVTLDALSGEACEPRVTDFGLAKRIEGDSQLTSTGQILGTPGYMPPEQAAGRVDEIDVRSDVYSLGAVLYATLTGRPPFQAANLLETLKQVMEQEPAPPRQLNADIDRDLETICLKCLTKQPERRYAVAAELADDLHRYLDGKPIVARRTGWVERVWRWSRRHPAAAGLCAASLVLVIAIVFVAFLSFRLDSLRRDSELRDARLAVVEKDRRLKEHEAIAARKAAEVQTYFSLMNQIRESRALGRPDSVADDLEKLQAASKLDVDVRDPLSLRNEAASILTTVDVRERAVLWQGMTLGRVEFSPTENLLAISQLKHWLSNAIHIFEIPSGEIRHKLSYASSISWTATNQVQDGTTALVYSADGRLLAAGTRSGMVHLWDLSSDPPQRSSWQAHDDEVRGIVFGLDGKTLFTTQMLRLRKWNLATRPPEMTQERKRAELQRLRLSRDGRFLARGNEILATDTLEVYGAKTSLPGKYSLFGLNPDQVFRVDGSRVTLVDVKSGRSFEAVHDPTIGSAHSASSGSIALHPGGWILAYATDDGEIKLWDLAGKSLLRSCFVGGDSSAELAFSRDGRYLASTAKKRCQVFEIVGADLLGGTPVKVDPIADIDASSNGVFIAMLSEYYDKKAKFVDVELDARDLHHVVEPNITLMTASVESRKPGGPSLSLREDGKSLAFTDSRGYVFIAHSAAETETGKFVVPENVFAKAQRPLERISLTPDGRQLWGAADWTEVYSWNVEYGERGPIWNNSVAGVLLGANNVTCLRAMRDAVAVGAEDGFTRILKSVDASVSALWENGGGRVTALATDTNRSIVVSGTSEGRVSIRTKTGEAVAILEDHAAPITSVDIGAQLLATSAADRTIRIYAQSGDEFTPVLTLRSPSADLRKICFLEGDKCLAGLVRDERVVRIWRIQELRNRLRNLELDWDSTRSNDANPTWESHNN